MDKQTSLSKPEVKPTTTDDESITTSTASDSFESWTLVTEKQKDKNSSLKHETLKNNTDEHIENLSKEDETETSKSTTEEEKENEPIPEHDASYTTSATDTEFSDEVSIISESDGGEIIKPHPYLQEHLHKLNLKFTTGQGLDLPTLLQQQQLEEQKLQMEKEDEQSAPPNTSKLLQRSSFSASTGNNSGSNNNQQSARQRKRRSPSVDVTQKALKPQTPSVDSTNCTAIQRSYFVRRVYSIFFYTIVGFLILGFFGKLNYPEWPLGGNSGSSSKIVNDLEQKLIDMELQNNLMRAEIDLLTKQVNYLNTLKDNNRRPTEHKKLDQNQWGNFKRKEQDKHWQDKTQFDNNECSAGDINCKTKREDFKKSSITPEETDDVRNSLNADEIKSHGSNDRIQEVFEEAEIKKEETNQPVFNQQQFQHDNKRNKQFKHGEQRHHHYHQKNDENLFNERFNKHNSRERRNSKEINRDDFKRKDDSNEKFKRNHRNGRNDDSKENRFKKNESKNYNNKQYNDNYNNDDSHERFNDSKERRFKHNGVRNDNSQERKNQKRRKVSSEERFDKGTTGGEWHEKLMNQREKARLEQEQRLQREKNWYLNRHDSREQWRTDEINRR